MRDQALTIVCAFVLHLPLSGCGESSRCQSGVPFSVDTSIDAAEELRLRNELGVAGLSDHCEEACMLVASEDRAPDGATYEATSVSSCTYMPPQADGMGGEDPGFLRCNGSGDRCNPE